MRALQDLGDGLMNVKDLVECLHRFPNDAEVHAADRDGRDEFNDHAVEYYVFVELGHLQLDELDKTILRRAGWCEEDDGKTWCLYRM